jgi:hypothetical protein
MSKKKSPPAVALQSVFVRDYQRRLRLVIELLEQEARRQSTPPTNLQSQTKKCARLHGRPEQPRRKVMKIAALYARVSSAKQQLNENIASQVAAIEEYARQNDYQISPQHVY